MILAAQIHSNHLLAAEGHPVVPPDWIACVLADLLVATETGQSFQSEIMIKKH